MNKEFNFAPFLDIMLSMLLGITMLWVLSLMLIRAEESGKSNILPPGEYVISIEWDRGQDIDVDLWMLNKNKNSIVFYNNQEDGVAHLDRDDQGVFSREYTQGAPLTSSGLPDSDEANIEHLTIRSRTPGEYFFNLFLFRAGDGARMPVNVTFKVERVNPYRLIKSGQVVLAAAQQELPIGRLVVETEGEAFRPSSMHLKQYMGVKP